MLQPSLHRFLPKATHVSSKWIPSGTTAKSAGTPSKNPWTFKTEKVNLVHPPAALVWTLPANLDERSAHLFIIFEVPWPHTPKRFDSEPFVWQIVFTSTSFYIWFLTIVVGVGIAICASFIQSTTTVSPAHVLVPNCMHVHDPHSQRTKLWQYNILLWSKTALSSLSCIHSATNCTKNWKNESRNPKLASQLDGFAWWQLHLRSS